MSVSVLSLLLLMPSAQITSVEALDAGVKDVAKSASMFDPDPDFVLGRIDWSRLTPTPANASFREEMKQALGHGCVLNAVRFVLQRRHDRMVGTGSQGDRIVYSMIKSRHIKRADLETEFAFEPGARDLKNARDWLRSVGIDAGPVELTADLKGHINAIRGHGGRGALLIAGEQNLADHTYVMFEFRDVGRELEARVYNPWTGALELDLNGSEWWDVPAFQQTKALPLGSDHLRLPKLDVNGVRVLDSNLEQVYVQPGDPPHASQTAHYSVLFAPLP